MNSLAPEIFKALRTSFFNRLQVGPCFSLYDYIVWHRFDLKLETELIDILNTSV